MKNADEIRREIEQMNVQSTASMREKILTNASQAMEQSIHAAADAPDLYRSIAMRCIAALTSVAAVVILFFSFFPNAFWTEQTPAQKGTSPRCILSNVQSNQSFQKEMIPCNILPVIPN